MAIDPYRVLGLPAGASTAEVKRAYRRLAKANHPDSAGEVALPRFLAIQQAYETLTATTWRPGMRRPSAGGGAGAAEPWRADPTRARSTPGAQAPGAAGARSSGGGRTAGPRPPGAGSGKASAGARPTPGAGSRADGATRPRNAGPNSGGNAGGNSGRRRPSKKATFGSTTYDEAREQADTAWSGASWYGPSSGEYWRVNPREYADPRKHGPEYQARAAARAAAAAERRARQTRGDAAGSEPAEEPAFDPAAADEPRPASGSRGGTTEGPAHSWRDERPSSPPPPRPAWAGASGQAGASDGPRARTDIPGPGAGLSFTLSPGARRLVRAVIAWPPLGIAAAAIIGEATGCAAFEATCTAPADLYPWLAQAGILLALLALPRIARVLTGGTVAVAILAFPVAAALSASGASYDRTYGPAALIVVLAVVWAMGVAAVLLRRAVTRGLP
jgi:hypothetical protein